MQVFNKLKIFFSVFVLTACSTHTWQENIFFAGGRHTAPSQNEDVFSGQEKFKVAMLLPLTGKAAAYGQGLQNAAMMAVEDTNNPHLVVEFYDTQSSAFGAQKAVQNALDKDARLILGPLMKEEVLSISRTAQYHDVPVISFSSAPQVLQDEVFTLGLLNKEQIERVVSYASKLGRRKIAVLVPDTPIGLDQAKHAVMAANRHGAEVVKIGFYPPETIDFTQIVKQMVAFDERSAEVNNVKAELEVLAKNGDETAAKQLKKLKTTYTTGELDFDALLIPESGNKLKSAVSMFGYYDIAYPAVLFMGTSVWENTPLNRETTLYNGIYPVLSRRHNDYFNKKYTALFGQKPNPLYAFAYDSVALASVLSMQNERDLVAKITSPDGYSGINGAFRIFEEGGNQHSLDIVKVTASGPVVVDAASKTFSESFSDDESMNSSMMQLPEVFGKNREEVYQFIFR